jgi:Protein of unknown function (DUF3460)
MLSLFKRTPMYESEATLFIQDLKKQNPALEASQLAGRALLWDKAPISLDERERGLSVAVAQQAYPYQTRVGK